MERAVVYSKNADFGVLEMKGMKVSPTHCTSKSTHLSNQSRLQMLLTTPA